MARSFLFVLIIQTTLFISCTEKNEIVTPYSNTPVVANTQNAFAYTIVAHNYSVTADYNLNFSSDSLAYSLVISGYSSGNGLLRVGKLIKSSYIYQEQLNSNKVVAFTDTVSHVPDYIHLEFNNYSGSISFSLAKNN